MSLRFPPLSSGLLAAQTLVGQTIERPSRAVTDPGVVTTRQSITPAGIPSVFQGRVYGVQFRSATELQVLTGVGVYRMDWQQNKVLRHTAALRGKAREAAKASMKMRFDVPDAVPSEKLNRILWGGIRGWKTPYPVPPRAVFAPLTVETDDERH